MAHASGYALQGRLTFQGLRVSIENKKGTYREDKAHTPPRWRTKMACHYGYVLGSEGVDGDHVDCFIGPNPNATRAYIVRQVRPDTGAFDEQKMMLGFDSIAEARAMYLRHYDTPRFFGGIRAMPMEEFKAKVLATLHGQRLLKSLRVTDQLAPREPVPLACGLGLRVSLLKSMVDGHWRQTHGGGRVWIDSYEDKRIVHNRPKDEQKMRPGDSLPLFPEIGFVRQIKEAPKPKPVPLPVNQLSMFSEFKSLDAVEEDTPLPYSPNALPELQYATPELRADLAACAMMATQNEEGNLAQKMRLAAIRKTQAETVAALFYGGLVSADNIVALRAVVFLPAFTFQLALGRLRECSRKASKHGLYWCPTSTAIR